VDKSNSNPSPTRKRIQVLSPLNRFLIINKRLLQHSLANKHVHMEISIKLDLNDKYSLDYEVNINGEKFKINTTWVVQNDCQVYQLSRWIYEIHGIYGKKNRRNLVVGLCADRSHGYKGGRCKGIYPCDPFSNYSLKFKPYNLGLIIN